MSRAFIREDVDPPERSGRSRSASGLPPGATNYISVRGAHRLQAELEEARSASNKTRVAELERVLASATIVDPPVNPSKEVAFGSSVVIETPDGGAQTYTIAGVDELQFEPDAVSWISPIGKALLAAEIGQWLVVNDQRLGKVVSVSYRA